MRITLTTPAGNIGSKVAAILLDTPGVALTLLARTPEKVERFALRGARIVAGDQLSADSLDLAVEGADALFWVTGMDYGVADVRGRYNRFADAAAGALLRHPELRLVHLSSIGAQLPEGTGPIKGLHDAEGKLNAAAKNITHLRANYFMENVLASLATIRSDSAIYSSVPGNRALEQVATADIAAAAAHWLLHEARGQRVVDVFGPEDITFDQVAATLSEALGEPVRHVQIPPSALTAALRELGLSQQVAAELAELQGAISAGTLTRVGDAQWRGATRFAGFAQEVVVPAYRGVTAAA
ncbi:MAG: NAD(P)H-binding protein [Acidobacteria bacterium]|nr:NAD(P)H-binding protein [Acidobacteriota bacterium]